MNKEKDNHIFLYFIKIIHLLLILFVILCPFVTNNKQLIHTNITLLFYFLFKWIINDEKAKCGLTQLEYYISGKEYEDGFIFRIIKPLVYIEEKTFNDVLLIIVILLLLLNLKMIK